MVEPPPHKFDPALFSPGPRAPMPKKVERLLELEKVRHR